MGRFKSESHDHGRFCESPCTRCIIRLRGERAERLRTDVCWYKKRRTIQYSTTSRGHPTLANQFQNHSLQQPNNCIIMCLLPTYPNFPQHPQLCKTLSVVRTICVAMRQYLSWSQKKTSSSSFVQSNVSSLISESDENCMICSSIEKRVVDLCSLYGLLGTKSAIQLWLKCDQDSVLENPSACDFLCPPSVILILSQNITMNPDEPQYYPNIPPRYSDVTLMLLWCQVDATS